MNRDVDKGGTESLPFRLIRPAETEDLDDICGIAQSSFATPWKKNDFAALIGKDTAVFRVCMLRREGETQETAAAAGYGCIQLAADEGDLLSIAVREEFRGSGIGTALLDALLKAAADLGARRIFLEVRESNCPAIRMYEQAGFRQVGIRRNYYTGPEEDALLMRWELE